MEFFTLKSGLKLAYELHRNAPTTNQLIILVHGTCANRTSVFFKSLSHLSEFNVLAFDLEGNGDSEGEFLIGGFNREVENVHEMVLFSQSLGFEVLSLVGHSKGGNTVLIYSSVYADVPLIVAVAARFDMSLLPKFLNPILPEVEENGFAMFGTKFRIEREGIWERRNLDMRKVLEGVRSRVAVVYGDRDDITPETDADRIAELLGERCFKKMVVSGSDHMFVSTLPGVVDVIRDVLIEFVSS